eukprot:15330273-Ditylum_brightwellii.AAC.2
MEVSNYDDDDNMESFNEVDDPLNKTKRVDHQGFAATNEYSELGFQASTQTDDKSDTTEVTKNKTHAKKEKPLPQKAIKNQVKMAMVQLARSKFQIDK